ncbi:hypothetical protein shn_13985 [Shinella sp. HZN7]|nr:hypothetical protein shn_13985 [Shinella sp. HZN7]
MAVMDGTDNNHSVAASDREGVRGTRVTIYCSTARKSESAIRHQITQCQRFVQARGWVVTDTFIDNEQTGRPGLSALLSAAEHTPPAFQKIVIADKVRLHRNVKRHLALVASLSAQGIELEIVLKPPRREDWFITAFMQIFDEYRRRRSRQR